MKKIFYAFLMEKSFLRIIDIVILFLRYRSEAAVPIGAAEIFVENSESFFKKFDYF